MRYSTCGNDKHLMLHAILQIKSMLLESKEVSPFVRVCLYFLTTIVYVFQLFERMCMALGGRVAESLTFNKVTTGRHTLLRGTEEIKLPAAANRVFRFLIEIFGKKT